MGKKKELIDYPTIKAAVAGEVWAIEKVVAHYADYIEEACTVEAKGPDGSVRKYVDEDMKQTVTRHLIEEIPKFPLIGQEGEA